MVRARRAVVALLLLIGAGAFLVARPASATDAAVKIEDAGFNPLEVTIHGGDRVTWTNVSTKDVVDVTSDDGRFDGQSFSGQFATRFDRKGDYRYHSSMNPSWDHGVVHVLDDAPVPVTTAPPAPATTARPTNTTAATTGTTARTAVTRATSASAATVTTGPVPAATLPTIAPVTTTTELPTTVGPSTTGGQFAIGQAQSSNRRTIVAVLVGLGAVLAVAGYVAYRRRLRSPF